MRHRFLIVPMLLAPRVALACPVCFGENDSPLASAIMFGVIVMIGFVVAVLGGFAAFIVHLSRRARLATDPQPGEGPTGPADAGGYLRSNAQEGTAQC